MRRRKPQLGRDVPLSPRQALTRAAMSAEQGDCQRARAFIAEARANSDEVDQRLLKERFAEVQQVVAACNVSLGRQRMPRRRKRR